MLDGIVHRIFLTGVQLISEENKSCKEEVNDRRISSQAEKNMIKYDPLECIANSALLALVQRESAARSRLSTIAENNLVAIASYLFDGR